MTESILDPQDGASGADSSHEADVNASYDEQGDAPTGAGEVTDGNVGDSHSADVEAGFDDEPE